MKKKIEFVLGGMTFSVPSECLRTTDYWNKPLENPYINLGRKETASIIKQFVKSKYPTLPVWASSQTFANGNSVDINVCKENGDEFDYNDPIYKEISSFCDGLKGGRYNGMEDMYEYGEDGKTDNGTRIDFNAKYVSCNPKAPFGSWADTKRMLVDMMAGKYVWGAISLEEAIKKAKSYKISDSNIEKALTLI
jgi:hypothetical protein